AIAHVATHHYAVLMSLRTFFFFLLQPPAAPQIYTLSLHDALPISSPGPTGGCMRRSSPTWPRWRTCSASPRRISAVSASVKPNRDRKSTRLNSSHLGISYAVFCLKKKK